MSSTMPSAPLDGVTILRYAHVFRDRACGGTEQYLRVLDEALLERNAMTILRMHLTDAPGDMDALESETVGRGRIVWVPVPLLMVPRSLRCIPGRLSAIYRNCTSPAGAWPRRSLSAAGAAAGAGFGHLRYPSMILSDRLGELLDRESVNLLVLHWVNYDVPKLVREARRRQIPFVVMNHFENSRMSRGIAAAVTREAPLVGGVSARNVPQALAGKFRRLSDAVDTGYFSPDRMSDRSEEPEPVVLLAGRITFGKGHSDLLRAADLLRQRGVRMRVQFAGLVDSTECQAQLEREIRELSLESCVEFLGQIGQDELRDRYGRAAVAVLPSAYEGLGRVLLEAGAMETPVVAYDSGGIPEAVKDGVNGYLVRSGDVEALAERLGELLSDGELRERMGRAARRFVVGEFGVGALVEKHESFYREALNGARPKGVAASQGSRATT